MNSKAFRDYFRSFRRKEVWEAVKWAPIYIWLLAGPYPVWREENACAALCFYYSGAIPVILRLVERKVYPLGLSKLQHLCPMNRKQKEDYVRTQFWAGFLVALFVFLILQVICWAIFPQQIYYILPDVMMILGLLGISFASPVSNLMEQEKLKAFREKELKGTATKGLLTAIFGICSWFIVAIYVADGEKIPLWIWIITVILLAGQLWMTLSMLGRVKYLAVLASDYERTNDEC